MSYRTTKRLMDVLQFYYENYTDDFGHKYNELALTTIYSRDGLISLLEKYAIDYPVIYADMVETKKRIEAQLISKKEKEIPNHFMIEYMTMSDKLGIDHSCPCCFDKIIMSTIHLPKCGHMLCKGCFYRLATKICPTCRENI